MANTRVHRSGSTFQLLTAGPLPKTYRLVYVSKTSPKLAAKRSAKFLRIHFRFTSDSIQIQFRWCSIHEIGPLRYPSGYHELTFQNDFVDPDTDLRGIRGIRRAFNPQTNTLIAKMVTHEHQKVVQDKYEWDHTNGQAQLSQHIEIRENDIGDKVSVYLEEIILAIYLVRYRLLAAILENTLPNNYRDNR
ncbi:hypothetical protein ACN38_g9356 [Penicillium nordicum]|uniref:Uncharacterized protein n=1 Tax=Penicillium nordicum TaxID=229535 RepID=A0A0M9WCN0_9EURO|nr:hypothetical protein ACN38_g9356 [Penicillium nordicum]